MAEVSATTPVTKMTIHRALAELKLLDKRIDNAIGNLNVIGIKQKDKKVNNFYSEDEFNKNAEAGFSSVQDLIERKAKIKSAIVKKNSETMVKVGDKEYSVADAITQKSIVEQKQKFLNKLKMDGKAAFATLNKNNETVGANLQKLLEASLGKDSTKINKDDVEAISKPFLENNQWSLADPLKIEAKVVALEEGVNKFLAEVDAILSESNAVTFIELN